MPGSCSKTQPSLSIARPIRARAVTSQQPWAHGNCKKGGNLHKIIFSDSPNRYPESWLPHRPSPILLWFGDPPFELGQCCRRLYCTLENQRQAFNRGTQTRDGCVSAITGKTTTDTKDHKNRAKSQPRQLVNSCGHFEHFSVR